MKKHLYPPVILILLVFFSSLTLFSQAPEGIIYQAEARDSKGHTIHNKNLDIKITILADYPSGATVWEGYHNLTTDQFGLFTLTIGEGTGGTYDFSAIDWAGHPHFLNVQVYYKNTWSDMGTTQLVSVPYALHAKTATTALSSIESDPVFQASSAFWISSFDISSWNQAVYWGDHSLAGYLKSYNETDPVFTGSSAHGIASTDIANWNSAFGWGNHADAGYLTHFTESDPVYSLAPAAGIDAGDIVNWNTALSWGNHAASGYLTDYSETDPVFSPSPAAGITIDGISNWNTAFGWGDHSSAGYLLSFTETDPLWTAAISNYYTQSELQTPGASQVDWYNLTSRPVGLDDGDDIDDADADPTNELQALTLNSNTLSLSLDATTVDLTEYLDNTDEQQLSIEGIVLSLDNSPDVVLNVDDADADPTNEIQELAINGEELSISEGNSVPLASLRDGVNDADHNPSNEIQTLSFDGSRLSISGGNSVVLGYPTSPGVDIDEQRINWIENQLFLLNGSFIDLRDNKEYPVEKIGEQLWMAANLDFYIDPESCSESPCIRGTIDPRVPEVMTDITYNMEAAQYACPAGWHLPTDEEWMLLELNSGMEEDALYHEGERDIEQCDGNYTLEGYRILMSLIFLGSAYTCDGHSTPPDVRFSFWSAMSYAEKPGEVLEYDHIRQFVYGRGVERYPPDGHPDEYHSIRCVKDFGATYAPAEPPRQ